MYIRGIGVELHHDSDRGFGDSDQAQVCLPKDPTGWRKSLEKARENDGYLEISIATTPGRRAVAFVIGESNGAGDPLAELKKGSFGFIVNRATLVELRGAIEAALCSIE